MLAALACIALGLRGLRRADVTYVHVGEHAAGVASSGGSLYLLRVSARMGRGEWFSTFHGPAETLGRGGWGFRWGSWRGLDFKFLAVPMALPAMICALIAVRLLRRARRGPLDPTLCRVCGYDLRASADRCPECGTAVVPIATKAAQRSALRGEC
jgi:hypothetical protein